jgi:hypothetical protein
MLQMHKIGRAFAEIQKKKVSILWFPLCINSEFVIVTMIYSEKPIYLNIVPFATGIKLPKK